MLQKLCSSSRCGLNTPVTSRWLISGNDETSYREEVKHHVGWCKENNLVKHQQNLQEKTSQYQWLHCREGGEHQVPGSADVRQSHLVNEHHQHNRLQSRCRVCWRVSSPLGAQAAVSVTPRPCRKEIIAAPEPSTQSLCHSRPLPGAH